MNFIQANMLLDEVIEFLLSCGGVYEKTTTELEATILDCIAYGQYEINRDENFNIIHAMFYWFITQEDAENVHDGIAIQEKHNGNILYVVEHGSKADMRSLLSITRRLKNTMRSRNMKIVMWNHKTERFKEYKVMGV